MDTAISIERLINSIFEKVSWSTEQEYQFRKRRYRTKRKWKELKLDDNHVIIQRVNGSLELKMPFYNFIKSKPYVIKYFQERNLKYLLEEWLLNNV